MAVDDEEVFEHTLLVVREVSVYKVPPRSTSGGHKCAEWLVSSKIWSGRLRVVSMGTVCEIRLEDVNSGELFAACRVAPGQREASVQNAVDSSRYFVLKIDDGRGRHAFIGLGFAERNEAFDFNVALSDFEKHANIEKSQESKSDKRASESAASAEPSADFRLKAGETIKINIGKPTGGDKKPGSSSSTVPALKPLAPPPAGGGGFRLAPPPGSAAVKLAPPPGAPAQPNVRQPTAAAPQVANVLPPSAPSGQHGYVSVPVPTVQQPNQTSQADRPSSSSAAGWTSF